VSLTKIKNSKNSPYPIEGICLSIKGINITFHVSDFPLAEAFYEDILGLQKKPQWSNYAVFGLCGIIVGLEPGGEKGAKKGFPDIYMQVDNVDDVYKELKSRGVKFSTEPKDQNWGARTAKF
jgi:catechol 2,3-dioxygenase-like lactoylglutathione lyase family enzyme